MKIEVEGESNALGTLRIVNGSDVIRVQTALYDRSTSSMNREDVFTHINTYWATLSKAKQKAIFDIYAEIYALFEDSYGLAGVDDHLNGAQQTYALTELVTQLYAEHDLADMEAWMRRSANIQYPGNLKDRLGPDDPPERTYIREDYTGLVFLAIACRPMVPVFSLFVDRNKAHVNKNLKEFLALKLMARTQVMVHPAMERLKLYIQHSGYDPTKTQATMSAILSGLGTSETPDWFLGLVVVRRLCVCDVNSKTGRDSVVSNIFNYIRQNIFSTDRKFGGRTKDKRESEKKGGGIEEDRTSITENYRIRQVVPDGDIVLLNVYTERMEDMLGVIAPEASIERLAQCYHKTHGLIEMEICQHHLALCQWVASKAISPRAIPNLTKKSLLRVMAVVQTALWHWNLHDLAVLTTCVKADDTADDEAGSGFLGNQTKLSKQSVEDLLGVYPLAIRTGSRQARERQTNIGCVAVEKVAKEILAYDWVANCPDELLKLSNSQGSRRFEPSIDLKNHLAQLLVLRHA